MNIDLNKIYEFSHNFDSLPMLNPNETDIYTCASRLATFLVIEQDNYTFKWKQRGSWIDKIATHKNRKIRQRMKIWLQQGRTAFQGRAKYLFWLANTNKYQTRKFIIHLLSIDEPKPDLEYLLSNLVKVGYNATKNVRWREFKDDPNNYKNETTEAIDRLVSSEEEYLRILALPIIDLPRMGGWRNTVIGWHERDLKNVEIYNNSDAYFDIGGGHHSPWYNNRFGQSFVSLDIEPPWPTNSVVLRYFDWDITPPKLRIMKDEMLESYEKQLQDQKWQKWNLYEDFLPIGDSKKITVVSSGFLTSTMTPPEEHLRQLFRIDRPETGFERFRLMTKFHTMVGIVKILLPVYENKSVELLTLSRPSKYLTKNRLCHIRWENQEIAYFDYKEHNRSSTNVEKIQQSRSQDLQVNIIDDFENDL